MNAALVTCLVFAFATVLSFLFWWQQRVPQISSNTLLVRAERWDSPQIAPTGVVYQAVRITTTDHAMKHMIHRSIYRDVQDKRRLKPVKLDRTESHVKNQMALAGVDWNEPLSASSYQEWHDHQHIREDHIARAGAHLLELTTTVPEGAVSEQSLTVRDTDFHPVRRTVAFRDSETVEIAEVDFKILPWSDVDSGIFEPLGSSVTSIASAPPRVIPFPKLPETLTEDQLDEAELGTRLVLNQLHADTGEQIEIHRTSQGVIVDGLVDTDERKRALQAGLMTVAHVSSSIKSLADIKNDPPPNEATTSASVASMPDQPSPLATYLQPRGETISDVNNLAQQLRASALTISRESKDISDLQTRFAAQAQVSLLDKAALSELLYSHRERLEDAIRRERALLSNAPLVATTGNQSATPATSSLMEAARKNLALLEELTQTSTPATRSATAILAEMSANMDVLAASTRETYDTPQGDSTLSRRK